MYKKASILTCPPLRAKTRISPTTAVAREVARRMLWYVEPLRDTKTKLADFFCILLVAGI